ncbi:MAG: pilin [Candidatus Falkowbacteria bacterium]|nr:pilin [Candidatus Falkowbacteria bacterium]
MFKKINLWYLLAFILLPLSYVSAESEPASSTVLDNPLKGVTSVPQLIGNVITGVLGIVGSLALLMFVYGGFMWMLSAGNEKMVEKGKTTLIWASLGLVVIFMSYALVTFVIKTATGG